MNKKELTPLAVHKAIEPYLEKEGGLFVRIDSKNDLIRFRGSSQDTVFFFHIKSHRKQNTRNQINIQYQPFNEQSVEPRDIWLECNVKSIDAHFHIWNKLLDSYNSTRTVFDDPIVESYEDEYFSHFEIVDDEKHKPLNPSSILLLHEHLEEIRHNLNRFKNEENSTEIEDIQVDIVELNNRLTNSGRQEIAERICRIWAKLTKQGVKFLEEFVQVSRKYVMKEATKGIFQLAQKGINYIEDLDKFIN